jgi:uncharacterized protein YndB with AHSA1/START domain
MTDRTIAVDPVRRRIWVSADPERAFETFTRGMTKWWPRKNSINTSPIAEVVVEPWAGGRWFERGEDGSECLWGKVLAWDPPGRLLLAWQISPNWHFDAAVATEVEICFLPDDHGTLVQLEHRLEGYGEAAEDMHAIFDSPQGWAGALESFAAQLR